MSQINTTFIALGSNLDDPTQQLRTAITAISKLEQSTLLTCSSLYQSTAIGPGQQADYINAVAKLSTSLTPIQLLDALQLIEQSQGRTRTIRWEPRTLDLDILLYSDYCINNSRLTIPHPEMMKRNFVLRPLAEIEPALILPNGSALLQQVQQCSDNGITKLSDQQELTIDNISYE